MSGLDYAEISADMQSVARLAGQLIMDNILSRCKMVSEKQSESDLVTDTDQACEVLITNFIREKYPSHEILAEESANHHDTFGDAPTWIIDPIDGTMNFAKTNPYTCVSIGFSVAKKPIIGVVYQPFYDEMFSAVVGGGAFLNGVPISVSKPTPLCKAMVNTGFCASLVKILKLPNLPADIKERVLAVRKMTHKNFELLLDGCIDLRRTGASALDLCWVASGRLDVFFECGNKEWDLAAAYVILTEAGGHCTLLNGSHMDISKREVIGASCEPLCDELVSLLEPMPCCFRQLEVDIEAFKSKSTSA